MSRCHFRSRPCLFYDDAIPKNIEALLDLGAS